ncbi:MAG: thioredoxin [Alphaproteobacteria bacterium]|nr:thioredoxin [Alphaproteobacteria bacterium]
MDQLISQPVDAESLVSETTDADFVEDVIEASKSIPIVVDFWAPWCGPCKQLTPVLEKVVKAAAGKVRLVKVDTDQNPAVAQQLSIQSIPAVFGFAGGRPVDGFMGALPESQVKAFVDKLVKASGGEAGPSPVEQALEQAATALDGGDSATAAAIYQQVLQHVPDEVRAMAGLAKYHLQNGRLEEAKAALAAVPAGKESDADVAAVRSAIELAAETAGVAGDTDDLRARVGADPADHEARYGLALALYGAGDVSGAVEALLEIIRRDRQWNDEAARKQLVKIFDALGPTDPVTVESRRKLSSILFS